MLTQVDCIFSSVVSLHSLSFLSFSQYLHLFSFFFSLGYLKMFISGLLTSLSNLPLQYFLQSVKKKSQEEAVLRWWRNRTGDHFLPDKFIKRSFECWATSTKQFLNADGEYQAPRKAAHSLQKEVGQNIKENREEKKELESETRPKEGVVKEEKFQNSRKPSHRCVCGVYWSLRGQKQGRKTHTHAHTHTHTHRIGA